MIFKNELWIIIRRIFPHLTLHGDYVCKPRGYTGTITEIFQKPRRTVPKTFFIRSISLFIEGHILANEHTTRNCFQL